MIPDLTLDFVLGLYRKFCDDLKRVRHQQRELYEKWSRPESLERSIYWRIGRRFARRLGFPANAFLSLRPQLDDVEAEITYLLVRDQSAEMVAEISPSAGWSSSWLLHALKDNGRGVLYSFDLVNDSNYLLPNELTRDRRQLIVGDVRRTLPQRPNLFDFLFMDSDHSEDFARWYVRAILEKLRIGAIVTVHDVFHTPDPTGHNKEGGVILEWLKKRHRQFLTASPAKEVAHFEAIMKLRRELSFGAPIHLSQTNSMIFFAI